MALDFEKFQEKLVEGVFEGCFVTYIATIADVETEEVVGKAKVVAEKDELIDFNTAITDDACEPIAEEINEQLDDDQEVVTLEPKFILAKIVNLDLSVTYIAFTPDGRTHMLNLSAQEMFEETLEALFE